MPVRSIIDSRGIALVTQAHERAPEARECQESSAANYEPDEVRNCNGVLFSCGYIAGMLLISGVSCYSACSLCQVGLLGRVLKVFRCHFHFVNWPCLRELH